MRRIDPDDLFDFAGWRRNGTSLEYEGLRHHGRASFVCRLGAEPAERAQRVDRNIDAQFFADLANQRLLGCLARLDLAARLDECRGAGLARMTSASRVAPDGRTSV